MSSNLRVTWQDGPWQRDGDQPGGVAIIPADNLVTAIVGETLVFRRQNATPVGGEVLLIIPECRLISAVVEKSE